MTLIWTIMRGDEWIASFADEQLARQWVRHRPQPWAYLVESVVVEEPAAKDEEVAHP